MAARVVLHNPALNRLLVSPSGQVSAHMVRQGILVANRAKALCPVDTGRLRSSIAVTTDPTSSGLVVSVGSNVEYAGYVENGTSRMRARPYLRPALDQVIG